MADMDVRQGSDITAADMVELDEGPSEILDFYKDATVFITGATGYIGKMILEKLLRTCTELKQIYVLVRPKKGKEIQKRFEEIFDGPNMEPLKRKNPNFRQKVTLVSGDCSLPDLGLSNEDKQKLIAEINVIIHCAATVRFDEKLRLAAHINVRSVRDLIEMGKQMKNLRAFVHISTAFCNCPYKTIDETFYEPPITADKLLALVEALDDDKLEKITPLILGKWPNTYVYTKAVAENVVKTEAGNLPIAVFRPSIVIASLKEPVAGWIDNFYGATGVLIGAALGVLRSLNGKKENIAEMVPSDFVTNSAIAVAWDIATTKSLNCNKEDPSTHEEGQGKQIPVYNFVSSEESPITWEIYTNLAEKHCNQIPSELCVWSYYFKLRPNYYHHLIASFFLHTVPAYLVDFIAICIGRKPMLVKGYQKIGKFATVIGHFALNEWKFHNKNVQKLWDNMNKRDKKLFEFSMRNFNWDEYFHYYARGARVYLLKDPLDTIPKGAVKLRKLKVAHYALLFVLYFLFFKFLCLLWSAIF